MRRRHAAAFAAALALGGPAWPQDRARSAPATIGVLSFGAPPKGSVTDPVDGLSRGLRDHAYVDGRNVTLLWRYAQGRPDRLAEQADELVRLGVRVIVAGGPAPLIAARKATQTIAIVAVAGSDPVREGWAASFRAPGGNVTGLTVTFPELSPKRLDLLKEALPPLTRVGLLAAPDELSDFDEQRAELATGARRLGIELLLLPVRGPDDFDAAFARAREGRAQALCVWATNTVVTHRARLAELALRERLPMIADFGLLADAGFLITYGADLDDLLRRAAGYIDKILRGARPGELPIERPSKFELTINLATARAIGVTLAPALRQRADRVIE